MNENKDFSIKACPGCGQRLRVPTRAGGITMQCPSCKKRFASDFKIGLVGKRNHQSLIRSVFEWPSRMVEKILK